MWDFDPDEWVFLILSTVAALILAGRYYPPLFRVWRLPARVRLSWAVWPTVCLIPTFAVLCTLADPLVRGHPDYITLFMVGGIVWVLGALPLLPAVGIRMRDDIIERANPAGTIVASAAMLASGLLYAGANIGTGATIWSTIIPALMAAGALAGAASIVRAASPLAEAVAVERHAVSGAIFAAFLIAASILLAWAAEGDFLDWDQTEADFARRMGRNPPRRCGHRGIMDRPAAPVDQEGEKCRYLKRLLQPTRCAAPPLSGEIWQTIRRRMMLDYCKWDPQIGDVQTLSLFPLLLTNHAWRTLARLAESAARELICAERELLGRPDLYRRLGVPSRIGRLLPGSSADTPRILRFDFHLTDDSWRLSEVNSDVPGGYTEASSFTRLMAEHYPDARAAGDVVARWADAITAGAQGERTVALLHAAGFLEDMQVVAYLADRLADRGLRPMLAHPRQIRFCDVGAFLQTAQSVLPLGAIVRFFQAEWLASRRVADGWRSFFEPCRTPIINSPTAILTESKRLPLVWDELRTPMPTWRTHLPETRSLRDVPWNSDQWLLKTAYCNTGDTVCIRELLTKNQWRRISAMARLFPGQWIAQRRFAAIPVDSPAGPIYPCLGVYTINGDVAGIYGRYSHRPLIDYTAVDVAVLIDRGDES